MDNIPTLTEFYEMAPIAAVVMVVLGAGYALAWWSRGETVKTLREWLEELRRK